MSFFSEDRVAELKALFFESAQELLQTLNEEGLELEKRPGDAEVIRSVRRTVHTLKGDSAACGYKELSELAHELEDVLTPDLAKSTGNGILAEVVLSAADTFQSMLAAYRSDLQPPSGDDLREHVKKLLAGPKPSNGHPKVSAITFAWTEYERLLIDHAVSHGETVYNIGLRIDPECPMRSAAFQLIRNILQDCGSMLALHPEEALAQDTDVVEAAITSSKPADWVAKKCHIPAVVGEVVVKPYEAPKEELATADEILEIEEPTEAPLAAAEMTTAAAPARGEEKHAEPAAADKSHIAAAAETILRVDAERIDNVLNLVGELIIGKSMLHQTTTEFDKRFPKDPLRGKFADALAFQARVLNDLQKSVMKIRMVPVEQLFRRFPRLVRDISKTTGKEVGLAVAGQDTDLDKSILDALAEPLAHLVRNAVDHGIELPADRVAAGKPAQGTIRLNAYHQGNQVVIEVSDDGRGIDKERVVAKAIERGIVTADEVSKYSEHEALNLIFHPGLSTAREVTAISGRGVGMDVVQSVMERLKGSVSIDSKPGQGTTFRLKVPLTLAIIKALLFRVRDKLYSVPLASVIEITRAQESSIHRVDKNEVIQLRDQIITLVRLGKLARRSKASGQKKVFIVVMSMAERKFGLVVDKLVGEEELVIKPLDDHLVATDLVSGASILGDGTVVLILNIQSVIARLGRAETEGGGDAAVEAAV